MSSQKINPEDVGITIQAKVTGLFMETTHLALDTGATYVMIPDKLLEAIHLKIDPKKTIELTSATKVERVPLIVIPEIEVLGMTAKNVEAVVKDLPKESTVAGLLGLSFLKHFKLTIDFKKGELSLE